MKELKVLELFGGIGACTKALKRLGVNHEIVDYVEIDPYAVKSYNAINGTNFEPQDITKWDKDIEVDLIMHGSPCFMRGTQINTMLGFKSIEDVVVGDIVKCHDGSYNKVVSTMCNKTDSIYNVTCSASHTISTTKNHPFYILRDGQHKWVKVKDIIKSDYMCIPINKESKEFDIISKLPIQENNFWYLIGRFVGDGWVTRRKDRNYNVSGIRVCCAKDELVYLERRLRNILHYCVVEDRSTYKLIFSNKELGEFCEQFGMGAINKHIPQWVLDLDIKYLEPLLEGILDSDGCYSKNTYKVTSISEQLVYNIGELVLKLKRLPYHIYKTTRPSTHIIEGRCVNQHCTYQITWRNEYNRNINYVDNDYLYSRVRDISCYNDDLYVYNLEVENTHTYCVYNIGVHNCQDFSSSGKQAGGVKGSGTRSSLIYETIRIVEKLKPKYVVWENVKNSLKEPHIQVVNDYIEQLNKLGYTSSYTVTNATYYGVPQERERVICVSILNGEKFEFPKEDIKTTNLEDYLDFRESDDITKSFYDRYKSKIDSNATMEDFQNYIDSLPIRKGIGTKKMNLYTFNEMDAITMPYGTVGTLTCRNVQNYNKKFWYNRKLYKPSPKMCWRLMGFDEEDFIKASKVNEDKALYNQAGNSIVVNVLQIIFRKLFSDYLQPTPTLGDLLKGL